MKKIAFLGSCLSALILKRLTSYERIAGLPHVRSDAFLGHLVGRQELGAPAKVIENLISKFSVANDPKQNLQLTRRLSAQSEESINRFVMKLKEADVLVIDNNYDLARLLFGVEHDGKVYRFSNLNIRNQEIDYEEIPLMGVDEMSSVYSDLTSELRKVNPRIRVILIQFPITGFEVRNRDLSRIERARTLASTLKVDGYTAFPLVKMRDQDLAIEKGALYFQDHIYSLYAQSLEKILAGDVLPFPPDTEIAVVELLKFAGVSEELPSDTRKDVGSTYRGKNPYETLPTRSFWKPSVGTRFPLAISELYQRKYSISRTDRIATCGSCFAQHIGRRLKANNFSFIDVEPAPEDLPASEHVSRGYGIYSARYGNVYTSTQLLQLFERAFGELSFDEIWEGAGRARADSVSFFDPFRPNIDPDGFVTAQEVLEQQRRHLAAVKRLFEDVDVFIFTMGLTELWFNKSTGAAYPTSPGVTAGCFDSELHGFRNLTYDEIMRDMLTFIEKLKRVNPGCRLVLTVSPVPLTATAEDRHVLISTMHSKSILRAVAGELASVLTSLITFPLMTSLCLILSRECSLKAICVRFTRKVSTSLCHISFRSTFPRRSLDRPAMLTTRTFVMRSSLNSRERCRRRNWVFGIFSQL